MISFKHLETFNYTFVLLSTSFEQFKLSFAEVISSNIYGQRKWKNERKVQEIAIVYFFNNK